MGIENKLSISSYRDEKSIGFIAKRTFVQDGFASLPVLTCVMYAEPSEKEYDLFQVYLPIRKLEKMSFSEIDNRNIPKRQLGTTRTIRESWKKLYKEMVDHLEGLAQSYGWTLPIEVERLK